MLGTISQADPPPPHGVDVSVGLPLDALGRIVPNLSPGFGALESQERDRLQDIKAVRARVSMQG